MRSGAIAPGSTRCARLPTAISLAATVGDGRGPDDGAQLAANPGLVILQASSGSNDGLLGIGNVVMVTFAAC